MKKAFVSVLLAVSLLSACSNQNIEIDHPTTPPTESVQKTIKPSQPSPVEVHVTAPVEPVEPTKQKATEPFVVNQVIEEEPDLVTVKKTEVTTVINEPTEATVSTEPVIKETEPTPTKAPEPVTTEPVPQDTVPPATEPPVTEPPATEPSAEPLDVSALEAYGRSYASDSYGYNGTSECTPDSGAGYFPASTKTITSQEEAERIFQEAIDSQYKRDEAYGYTPYEEVDGETVRCPVNVEVTPTGEPNEYTITVYYGGTS